MMMTSASRGRCRTACDAPEGSITGLLRSEKGIALLLVIWVGAFFSLVLIGFAFSMRVETDATRNFRDHAQAVLLAEAGIAQALADLANTKPSVNGLTARFQTKRIGPRRYGPGTYEVLVTNENGKISVNHASEAVLRRLLDQSGVKDVLLQETIAASILDWRDADDVERPSGAESEFYRSGTRPYAAKNAPFQRVEELLSVKGVTRDILFGNISDPQRREELRKTLPENRAFAPKEYLGVRPYLTVYGSGHVDSATAEWEVLRAMDVPADKIREILQAREWDPASAQLNQSPPGAGSNPRIYRFEAIGRIDGSPILSQIHAVFAKEGSTRVPRYRIVAWQELEE